MERTAALDALPHIYGEVLRWREAGLDDVAIADRLDIEPGAVALVLRVAQAKLVSLLGTPSRPAGEPTPAPTTNGAATASALAINKENDQC